MQLLSRITLLLLLLSFTHCGSEPVQNADELIVGHWQMDRAFRNGDPTQTLDNLYFEFFADGQMRTNFPGQSGKSAYRIEENTLLQTEVEDPLSFQLLEITDSTLVLKTVIRDYDFRMEMRKKILEH